MDDMNLDDMEKDLRQSGIDPYSGNRLLPVHSNSFLNSAANSSPIQAILGGGDALRNMLSLGYLNKPSGSGTAYNLGNIAGNVGGFIGGGEVLDLGRGAIAGLEKAPQAVRAIADFLGKNTLLKRSVGTGLGGAATNPDNRGTGFAEGALASGALEKGIPLASKGISGASKYISKFLSGTNPELHVSNTIQELGQEAGLSPDQLNSGQALEGNSKNLAASIKNNYEKNLEASKKEYDSIFKDPSLQDVKTVHSIPGISGVRTDIRYSNNYDKVINGKNPYGGNSSLNELHRNYYENPSIENAQKLQSELGKEGAYLNRKSYLGTANDEERKIASLMGAGREALKNDIRDTIQNHAPHLTNAYDMATQNFLNKVIPYYGMGGSKIAGDSFLKEMATGKLTNPSDSQINSTFAHPEPGMNQLISDLGERGKANILFNTIGKLNKSNLTPQKLISADEALDAQRLGGYKTQNYRTNMDVLPSKMKKSDITQRLTGLAGGALLGHLIAPGFEEVLSGLGALTAPSIAKNLSLNMEKSGSLSPYVRGVIDFGKKSYLPIGRATIANELQGRNQYGSEQ